jgi:thiamine monophosphate synthase
MKTMKANRQTERHAESSPSSRRRKRRSEDEIISALQAKITMLERRKQMRAVKQDPVLKLADKLVRTLKKAEAEFASSQRLDLANSAKAAAIAISAALHAS